jgi:hypothetical protein
MDLEENNIDIDIDINKNDKLRLVALNTYYGKKYNAQKKIMQTIILICIPIIIIAYLKNNNIFPPRISALMIIIILVIGLFNVGRQILDLLNRSNMNFDEYNWYFDKEKAPATLQYDINIDGTSVIDKENPDQWESPSPVVCV